VRAVHDRPAIEQVTVLANERVAEGVGLIALHAPRTAASIRPGQFVHVRVATGADIILRRPFSVHRVQGERIELLYQILGTGTLRLAEKPAGASMDVVGPLGHGWEPPEGATHALLVAGGLGAAPLGMLAEQLAERGVAIAVAQGAPTASRLVARELFERVARRVELATDDGTAGERGFVTGPVARLLAEERFDAVFTCGPEPMQRLVAQLAAGSGVPCQVSLERLMGCGIGACLSCVVTTRDGLKRACVDGPVFDAEEVVWDASETPPKH
jgi:dihydroorotate dehydrogenase electron transfer subunit